MKKTHKVKKNKFIIFTNINSKLLATLILKTKPIKQIRSFLTKSLEAKNKRQDEKELNIKEDCKGRRFHMQDKIITIFE